MKKAFLSILVAVLALPALAGMIGMTAQSAYADEARPQDWSQDGSNPQENSGTVKEGTDDKSNAERAAAAAEDDDGSGSTDSDGIVYKCGNAGGADALGWILCPAMTLAGNATNYIYNTFVEPSLKIEPKLFTSDQGGVDKAWGTFRDIANVLFVILFLVVIISQLTGVGIDNYGIKKILPKLIVVAILINLSYILCIILIDISNIIGNSIQALFDGLGSQLSPAVTIDDAYDASGSPISGKSILATGGSLAVMGIIGVIVGMTGAVWATPGILLSAVLGIVGIAVSIFFLFLLLAAREAAIVILVVLSPLAVACYMLPNTKKLFDRWVDIFKAMLLLYPICGLLVGGGNYVSSLLLTVGLGDGFFTAITAMLVGIVPIFFIPSLTKQAFAAIGSLGGRIAGYGDRWRGRAQGTLANSRGFRSAQENAARYATRKRAGLDRDGNLTVRGEKKAQRAGNRFGRFIGSDRRLAADQFAAKKNMAEAEEANAVLINTTASGKIAREYGGDPSAYYRSQFNEAAAKGDAAGMNAALSAAVSSGYMKDKDIAKFVRGAINGENGASMNFGEGAEADAKAATWKRDLATKYGNGFLATDFELKHHLMNGGNEGGAHELGDYGSYAAAAKDDGSPVIGTDDIRPEDITRLSGDSLAGMAQSGKLTQGMAQRVLANNPDVSDDKKIMLQAVGDGIKVTDGAKFKSEAKALAADHKVDQTGFTQITGVPVDKIDAWTSNTPQDVNVVNINHNDSGNPGGVS